MSESSATMFARTEIYRFDCRIQLSMGSIWLSIILADLKRQAKIYSWYMRAHQPSLLNLQYMPLSEGVHHDLLCRVIRSNQGFILYGYSTLAARIAMSNYHGFSMMLIVMVTHCLVSAMAIERYLGIRHGYWYSKNVTQSKARTKVIVSIWMFCIFFCMLPLFGLGQYARQYPGTWCFVNTHLNHRHGIYKNRLIIFYDLNSPTPWWHRLYTNTYAAINDINLLVIVTCNVIVITTLLCLRLCRRKQKSDQKFRQLHRNLKQKELEIQMAVMLVVITLVFILSFMPLDVDILAIRFIRKYIHQVEMILKHIILHETTCRWLFIMIQKMQIQPLALYD
ncbi:unnamed protein product, partial [Meganyctiphanes norvegica]